MRTTPTTTKRLGWYTLVVFVAGLILASMVGVGITAFKNALRSEGSLATPSLDAYNTERAARLQEHRAAGVYIYADIPDKRLYGEPTAPDAFRDSGSFGSGTIISASGDVLTAEHVVSGICKPTKDSDGVQYCAVVNIGHTQVYRARVILVDKNIDAALLRIEGAGQQTFASVRVAPVEAVAKLEGREVQVLGIPLGYANTAVVGLVSNAPDNDEPCSKHQMRLTLPVAPGNSGGGVVDLGTGRLISIVSKVSTIESTSVTKDGKFKREDVIYLNVSCSTHLTHLHEFLKRAQK